MPFFLANPFLWFSLAALVPVALHLLHRKKPRPVFFAAFRFLKMALEQSRRSRRLTQCTALLLRVLILLALAAAFAQPLLRFARFLPEGRRLLVIVVDASASMQALEGGVSRFELARVWALDLLQGLRKDDLVAVLAPGSPQERLIFPPVSAHREVIQALSELQCGWGKAGLLELVRDCLNREEGGLRGVELHLFSDFQQSDFNLSLLGELAKELEKRRGVLFCNRIAKGKPGSCGFSEVQFFPPAIIASGAYQARATISASENFSGSNVLRLLQDGRELGQAVVDLLPGGSEKAVLRGSPTHSEGEVSGYLELEPDSFLPDNRFYFSLPRLAGIPALLVSGDGNRDTFFLEKAISPGGHASTLVMPQKMDWVTFAGLDIAEYSFLFLCNPQQLDLAVLNKIRAFAESGGLVAIFPGENQALSSEALRTIPGWEALSVFQESVVGESPYHLVLNDQNNVMAKAVAGKLPPPWKLPLRKRLKLDAPAGHAVAWMYEEGGAFVLSAELGAGQLWLFSVSANRDWSDWPITPFFFVFMQELIRNGVGARHHSLMTEVDGVLPVSWPGRETEMLFELKAPDGKSRNLALQRAESHGSFLISGFTQPGIYQLKNGDRQHQLAVNVSPAEGLLSVYGGTELRSEAGKIPICISETPAELQRQLAEQRQGRPLWPSLLLLAFFLSMLEVLFANLRSRHRKSPAQLQELLS
ncbi:MAG: BatA domain-containing protein [Lentisphaeria bacterium]